MTATFYACAAVAVIATAMVITRRSAMHALLYFIVSLLAVAVIFYIMGAVFVAALEVIIYAGAIMVLFVFVIMMLNQGEADRRRAFASPWSWAGPAVLAAVLLVELVYVAASPSKAALGAEPVNPREVGRALFGPYVIGVEIASLLLLCALVGVFHLGRRGPASAGEGE